ncbi:MAG: LacI family DNA-binding transcriptional regulator [Candidatus Goldbacteria bacterium]|nr:LacI family DNA-binding transcriptional regulator [Candidatus Goldiibacteriota bacterium]
MVDRRKKEHGKLSIREIAKKTKVSPDIVSRIIKGETNIPEDVRVKVLKFINKAHYKIGMEIITRRTNTISLMAPFFYAPFISEIVDGIEHRVVGTNYNLSQYSTKGILENERYIFQRVIGTGLADAFILFNIPVDKDIQDSLRSSNIPVVSIEKYLPGLGYISTDNLKASYEATEYLIHSGKKNIAIVIGKRYIPDIQNDRIKGYMLALDANKIDFNEDNIFVVPFHDFNSGIEIFETTISKKKDIDAIFCMAGDVVATGILYAAKKAGINVPQNLAVIGYDDLELASFVTPALTTVKQPTRKMGEAAIDMIINGLENKGKKYAKKIVFQSELVKRESA